MTICVIEGCFNPAGMNGTAKGYCRSHYKRYLRYGNPCVELRKVSSWKGCKCLHVDCDRDAFSLHLCEMHYVAERRRKNPEIQKRRSREFAQRRRIKQELAAGRPKPELCEICEEFHQRIVWDHCHNHGHFRGWICDRCNKVLGLVYESSALLGKLRRYLEDGFTKDDNPVQEVASGV